MSSCASKLEELPGLEFAKAAVRRILTAGAGVHAVLFYGPRGAGKKDLATLLAQSWLCTSPVENIACGECSVCKTFEAGRAVDFQLVPPWGPMHQIKTSALYPIPGWENDRERPPIEFVLHYFRTRPLMARNKVVLFDQADRMNSSTANAFLKTLEEPGETCKIIMTTSEFTRIIPTVRSRCMCVACGLPELSGETPAESAFGASPGGVVHVRENQELFDKLLDLLERSSREPLGAALRAAEECRAISEAYAKATGLNARFANARILEAIGEWASKSRPTEPRGLKAIAEAHRLILGNVQAQIVFDNLFLDLLYHG